MMNTKYYTVQGYGHTEIEINKSRFISYINRVVAEEEVEVTFEQSPADRVSDSKKE